jgi:hypothetical protein
MFSDENKERGRQLLAQIRDGMEVVDPVGTRVGTVTRVEGGHLKILRPEQEPHNAHQFVAPELIQSVDDRVVLARSWDELRRLWSQGEFAAHHGQHRPI